MPENNAWQLQGNAAQIYEEQKVPEMFRPLAEATLSKIAVPDGIRVIDVACGTGIVSRLLAEKIGKSGSIVGIDLNAGMIEVAERSAPSGVEWHQGDVMALPFPDHSFDMAFCQQGLQFFPEKVAALQEIRRVLVPGGALIVTVWSAVPALATALAEALTKYVSPAIAKTSLAPYMFIDLEVIKGLFIESGFSDIKTEVLVVDRKLGSAEESIPLEIASTPYGADVEKLDEVAKETMFREVGEALKDYGTGDGFSIPQHTHLIRATA